MVDDRSFEAVTNALRILVFEGHVSLVAAASWLITEHPELDRWRPAQWAQAGRDPDQLLLVARRDAARFAQ